MEFNSIFDLERDVPAQEDRETRCTRELFRLLETRTELRGVYGPADAIAETLRWSA